MSNRPKNDIPIAFLAERLVLDPTTPSGLRWRYREDKPKCWNAEWAGKPTASRAHKGYLRVHLTFDDGGSHNVAAHRIVFALTHGYWPPDEIDHRNGVRSENKIVNLREATHAENGQNRKRRSDNTSGYPGVSWSKEDRKWRAMIMVSERAVYLGHFDTPEQAFARYLAAKAELHPFAPLPYGLTPRQVAVAEIWASLRRLSETGAEAR